MKKGILFTVILRMFGIVILITGIRLMTAGVWNYIEQHHQEEWPIINAEVSDVSSRVKSSGTVRHNSSKTVYDIVYKYEVDGEIYSEELKGRSQIRLIGDRIKIKYNPERPEISTTTLSPSIQDMVVFLIAGAIFGTLGFFLSGTYALIRKIRRRGQPEEDENLPPEEYVNPKTIEKVPQKWSKNVFVRLLLFALVLGIIFLSNKLFPGTQSVDAETFREAAEAVGYTTTDTTEKLRQEWRVGSMLTEAVSFNNGMIRMDFCVMDTVDSSVSLYSGMTLPVADGEITDNGGIIHEIYSVENQTNYVAKVRIRDTLIYVFALSEYKDDVIELLESIGYWKD